MLIFQSKSTCFAECTLTVTKIPPSTSVPLLPFSRYTGHIFQKISLPKSFLSFIPFMTRQAIYHLLGPPWHREWPAIIRAPARFTRAGDKLWNVWPICVDVSDLARVEDNRAGNKISWSGSAVCWSFYRFRVVPQKRRFLQFLHNLQPE